MDQRVGLPAPMNSPWPQKQLNSKIFSNQNFHSLSLPPDKVRPSALTTGPVSSDQPSSTQDLFDIHLDYSNPLFSLNPLDSSNLLDSLDPLNPLNPLDSPPVLTDPKKFLPSTATMANEHDAGKRLKRKPSLQKCVEWLAKRKSFASLVEKTAMASSNKRATSPIREDTFPSPDAASPSSTRRASPAPTTQEPSRVAQHSTPSRAATTPPPKIDVHISTSPIDWYSPILPPPKPAAAADSRDRGGRPLPLSITKEELAALRGQARQNIRSRAAAAIAAATAVVALPDPDWVTALASVAAAAPDATTASASTTAPAPGTSAAATICDNGL